MKKTSIETALNSFKNIMILEFLNTGVILVLAALAGINKLFLQYEYY